jgi:uncharacterized membrane protein YagU involved in acid resistance
MTAITGAIATNQALVLAAFGTVAVAGLVVAIVKWGGPQALKFFKRMAS